MAYPLPENEAARLEALRQYEILDTAPEQGFDDITELASFICGTPIAVVTLVDQYRQWFKSRRGLTGTETPREQAFCAHTIMQQDLLVVEDALTDTRFAENPLVTGQPNIRFYAGAPLVNKDGFALGSLCVIDREPRKLTSAHQSALQALARLVINQMETRRVSAQLADVVVNVRTLSGLLPICAYCKGIRDDKGYWQQVEAYMMTHTDAEFTHGICPKCSEKQFPWVNSVKNRPKT